MRKKEEIVRDYVAQKTIPAQHLLILEVLLDIRDALTKEEQPTLSFLHNLNCHLENGGNYCTCIVKEEPKKAKIEIIPSGRIDWCGACKKEHGYDCPLDTPAIPEKLELDDEFISTNIWQSTVGSFKTDVILAKKVNETLDYLTKTNQNNYGKNYGKDK